MTFAKKHVDAAKRGRGARMRAGQQALNLVRALADLSFDCGDWRDDGEEEVPYEDVIVNS